MTIEKITPQHLSLVSPLPVSLFATSDEDWPAAQMIPFSAPHPISFRLSADATSVNCSADSEAVLSEDAAGNAVWLVAGPESILGGEQLDLTCTVFYLSQPTVSAPSFLNVSLEGQDHCQTYLDRPTAGPGPTAGPTVTFEPAPTTTFVDTPDYCCGSWGSYLMEDDREAGKATSRLSVIARTNYTDGVQIGLR